MRPSQQGSSFSVLESSKPSWVLETHVSGDDPLLVLECDIWGAARKAAHDSKAQTVLHQGSAHIMDSQRMVVEFDSMEVATGGLL